MVCSIRFIVCSAGTMSTILLLVRKNFLVIVLKSAELLAGLFRLGRVNCLESNMSDY